MYIGKKGQWMNNPPMIQGKNSSYYVCNFSGTVLVCSKFIEGMNFDPRISEEDTGTLSSLFLRLVSVTILLNCFMLCEF